MNYVQLQQIPLPPTSNHRLMPLCMKGRGRLIKTKKFREWESEAADWIRGACEPMEDTHLFVRITIRWPDKRKRDIDSPVKPLLDLIVREGFILDDSMIGAIVVQRQEHDPDEYGDPGTCDITVMPYADWKVPF